MTAKKAGTSIQSDRLFFRKPAMEDAEAVFSRYAGDELVCRFLAWPRHHSLDDTRAFIEFSNTEWERWPAGPFLIFEKRHDVLIGSTGLGFESPECASTGYVLARDAWGCGFATETLLAMRKLAGELGVQRFYAHCHPDHRASQRVLEKGGLTCEGKREKAFVFPNLSPGEPGDVLTFACRPGDPGD